MTQATSTPAIRLIVTDIDGTLLNSQHEMTERTEKALKAALEKGVQIVLATGKTFHSGAHIVKRLNLTTPGVYVQGTTLYNSDGTLHSQQTLDPRIARQVITFAEDRGYLMAIYTGARILVRSMNSRMEDLTVKYHEPVPEAVGSLQNVLDSVGVNKLLAVKPQGERAIKALRWQLSMQINGSARLLQAGVPDMLEILPPNVSKASGLKALLKELGLRSENVMAIGDAENDIEMLQLAGVGVAVGNANPMVQKEADAVVASNDQDGVAEAVERFVLNAAPTAELASQPQTVG